MSDINPLLFEDFNLPFNKPRPLQWLEDKVASMTKGIMSSPYGFKGPGILSNMAARGTTLGTLLGETRSPLEIYNETKPAAEFAASLAAAIPAATITGGGLLPILSRTGTQAGMSALTDLIKGNGPLSAAKSGAVGGALQLGGEGVFSGIRGIAALRAGSKQTAKNAAALTAAQDAYEQQMANQAEKTAAEAMDYFKQKVPALKEFPSTQHGLGSAVYGEGPIKVSKAFEDSFKAMRELAGNITVTLPAESAALLGVKAEVGSIPGEGDVIMKTVLARDLMSKMLGKSMGKTAGAYKDAVSALDAVGLIDKEAQHAYRSAQALMDFVDENKLLSQQYGNRALNMENVEKAVTDTDKINALRNRGEGNIDVNPFKSAEVRPAPPDVSPTSPLNPDAGVTVTDLPGSRWGRAHLGALLGGPLGGGVGALAGNPLAGAGIGGSIGGAIGALSPNQLRTAALSPELSQLLGLTPSVIASLLSGATQDSPLTMTNTYRPGQD